MRHTRTNQACLSSNSSFFFGWLSHALMAACLIAGTVVTGTMTGCKRSTHFRNADRDAYSILSEKAGGPTWRLENGYNVRPDVRSRFHDATCYTDPTLPVPAPQLYDYQMPGLATPQARPRELETPTTEQSELSELTSNTDLGAPFKFAGSTRTLNNQASEQSPLESGLLVAVLTTQDDNAEELPVPSEETKKEVYSVKPNPIPTDVWDSLPTACLERMLEFEAVREEYFETFQQAVSESQLDDAQRVTLENILELALINNRAYQTRKETLYRTALALSLERFQYDLRFFSRGNGTDVGYIHNRFGGIEVNTLRTPTTVGVTKSLYSAGELAARFANDVVLTFNGATGYSSRVGSEILIDLSQPLLQRDVQFEPLTQSERDVVYAARDYVRFRKTLFRDLANRYYNLLLTYRNIAIDTQDYFSNLRGFLRAGELESIGDIPRFQVDQFEQFALASRGNLIDSCNNLEGAIDRLKFEVGLPTEMPLNLDLSELETLTIRDEAAVVEEQVRRKMAFVGLQLNRYGVQGSLPLAAELIRRLQNLDRLTQSLETEDSVSYTDTLQKLLMQAELEASRIDAIQARIRLTELTASEDIKVEQLLPQVFDRNVDYLDKRIQAMEDELELLVVLLRENKASDQDTQQLKELVAKLESAIGEVDSILSEHERVRLQTAALLEFLPEAVNRQNVAADRLSALDSAITAALAKQGYRVALGDMQWQQLTQLVMDTASEFLSTSSQGLVPVEVEVDTAMLTALVQRLDLMNARGDLADAWRDVKFAGDNLRGILNIEASQSIRTRLGSNNPFDFSFDDSTTSLGLRVDTPLNRRAERNLFRLALINYNLALRNVQSAEDSIKLSIRDGLRSLELGRNQYEISVASAALAYERVVSTRLQLLAPGRSDVSARDVLESQQAYTQSLSSVARQHIRYITDRVDFFLDLEQLQVDEQLFWSELRIEESPFIPAADFPAANPRPYGTLPTGPWYSDCIRRMERIGPGQAMIHRAPEPGRDTDNSAPNSDLAPAINNGAADGLVPATTGGLELPSDGALPADGATAFPAQPLNLEITPSGAGPTQ